MKSKYLFVISIVGIFAILFVVILSAPKNISEIKYKEKTRIGQMPFTDSLVYLHDPAHISRYKELLIVTDNGNSRILVIDTSFNLKYMLGKRGRGPSEFMDPNCAVMNDNYLFVKDNILSDIKIFKKDSLITAIQLKRRCVSPFGVDRNNNIYLSSQSDQHVITKVDIQGNVISEFGEIKKEKSDKLTRINSAASIVIDEGQNIYALFYTTPIIQKYDPKGTLLWETNLSYLPAVKKRLEEIEESNKKGTSPGYSYQSVGLSISVDKNKAYCKMSSKGSEQSLFVVDAISGDVEAFVKFELKDKKNAHSILSYNNKILFIDTISDLLVITERE